MRLLLSILFWLSAANVQTAHAGVCMGGIYVTLACPWHRTAASDAFVVQPTGTRWSRDGYVEGSAAGRWHDGIYAFVSVPVVISSDSPPLHVDIAYEPHWQPRKTLRLEPFSVTLRLRSDQWRAEEPQRLHPLHDGARPAAIFDSGLYRFAFGHEVVAAMLAASKVPEQSRAGAGENQPSDSLHFEIFFRDADGNIVSARDILDVERSECQRYCQPQMSLAGFAEAYTLGGDSDE